MQKSPSNLDSFIGAVLTPVEGGWTPEDRACWEAGAEKRAGELKSYEALKRLHADHHLPRLPAGCSTDPTHSPAGLRVCGPLIP